ncbi:hypothetical protein [Nocardioides sp.]|uniref:hypothetical protein n=1 Tax=Nocardioides sp. TaxID=35761 RepID=UPI0025D9853F|nr:hypothetical protein [Nocardioides sp.]
MTEESFVRELERRADHAFDGTHGTPITFEAVRSKAHGIRRRRRTAAAGAVAAAVAVAILVPTVWGGSDRPGSEGIDPATTTTGHGAVLHDRTLTLSDGTTVPLDVDDAEVQQLGVLTDGRIIVPTNQPNRLRVFGPAGELRAEYSIGTTLIRMSPTNDAVAWMEGDGSVMVLSSDSPEPVELGTVEAQDPSYPLIDAVVDSQHVLVGDGNTTTTEVTPDGVRPLTTSEPLRVTDVSPDGDLWAVQYADDADPQFGCAGLYEPMAARIVARSCETANLTFSPEGQHLLGARGDNAMIGDAAVFDLDLGVVGRWESADRGDVLKSVKWLDAEHLLVVETNWKDSSWALTRVDLTWSDRAVLDTVENGGNPEMMNEFPLSE